jgi:hypothetical protein
MSDTRVNTITEQNQWYPVVAMSADGSFVVAWRADGSAPLGWDEDIYARRYNAAGVAIGAEFRVNTYTWNLQRNQAVAMDVDGDFVVAWESNNQDGWGFGIYAQRYGAGGVAVGGEFRVNTTTASNQNNPAVAMDSHGHFVVTWAGGDWPDSDVYAQRYNSAGAAIGAEFRVNTHTGHAQVAPQVAMDADGDFVVTWFSRGQDGSGYGVYAQRYSASGASIGNEFKVNTTTIGDQVDAAVAMDADGDFVITWMSRSQDADGSAGIYAQRYNAAGAKVGIEFQVNTSATGNQSSPSVDMDASGNFVITWTSLGQDGSEYGIYAQRFSVAGVAIGGETRVNTYTPGSQYASTVALDANGDVVAVWNSHDGSGSGVYLNFLGDGGDDTLTSSQGVDILAGGFGDDWASYASATGAVTIDLGAGSSNGGHGIDQLISIEAVLGGSGADSLLGDGGSNTLNGGAGADTMAGGAGNDVFFVLDAADLVIESAGGGADTIITSVSMTAPVHVESLQIAAGISGITLTGGAGNDMLIGNGLANTFMGGAGDDVILVGTVTLADIYALFAT